MDNWKFKPCPFCGSEDISVGYEKLDFITKGLPSTMLVKAYGACNYCGARSGTYTVEVIGNKEILAAAIEKWNQRKG